MPDTSTPHAAIQAIRSLALVGQTGAGKTSLAEALLQKAGGKRLQAAQFLAGSPIKTGLVFDLPS